MLLMYSFSPTAECYINRSLVVFPIIIVVAATMFGSTFALDLMSHVVSNNLCVFFVFNLIIVMVLVGSKHGSDVVDQIPLSSAAVPEPDLPGTSEEATANHEDEARDDDELRTRVEEFIAKVNAQWRVENLQMCILKQG
ncbi:hypothetical protein V6N13_032556 [Hibiscus sabdariffa]|uniref:Uncharacterized protein n=1 Tax=Hibiscus sabdariffa TaxID=183260 RepID=A0ABR2B267_9ROSI